MSKLKVALCFSGMPRFIKECFEFYDKNILSKYDVNVFAHLWNDITTLKKDSTNPDHPLYRYEPYDIEEFKRLYLPKSVVFDDYTDDYDQYLNQYAKKYENPLRNFNKLHWKTFSMFQSIQSADTIRREYEATNNIKHDIVIRCRTDMLIYSKPELDNVQEKTVYMPVCNASGGINDTFWYSDHYSAEKISQLKWFCDNFDHNQLEYKNFPHETLIYCLAWANGLKIHHTLDNQVIYRWRIEKGQPDHLCRDGLWITENGWKGDFGNRWIVDRLV